MSVLSLALPRRRSRKIFLKNLAIGGDAPISVQSMTNTPTHDVEQTVLQIERLQKAGAELVRLAVNDFQAAEQLPKICRRFPDFPLIADIHYDWRLAMASIRAGIAGLRLNPGNCGEAGRVRTLIREAKAASVPIRVGVNSGSLPTDLVARAEVDLAGALVEAAQRHLHLLEKEGFEDFKVSVKATQPRVAIEAYRRLATMVEQPLHLGITEAGGRLQGTVKSAVGIGILLYLGLGDTIRVSLAAPPEEEVRVGFELLKSLGLRVRGPNFTACPTCARAHFDVVGVTQALEEAFEQESLPLEVAIMGCEVNGPGECQRVDVGVAGAPGRSFLYLNGQKQDLRMENANLAAQLIPWVAEKLKRLPQPGTQAHERATPPSPSKSTRDERLAP